MCTTFILDSIPFYSEYNKKVLEQENGNRVISFDDPREAIKEAENGNIPDIVVLDTILPFINGMDIIEKLSKISKDIKFMVVTGDRRHLEEVRYKNIPIMDKPFLVSEFTETFRKIRANRKNNIDTSYIAYEEGYS